MIPNAISILVTYHSGQSYLKACLESLIQTVREKDEILVVVNNESQDVNQVNLFTERITYLYFQENLGYARAVNEGVNASIYDYMVLADHDLVFQPNWLEGLWAFYDSDPKIAAVSCKVLNTASNAILDYGIAYSDFNLGHPFMDLSIDHPLVQSNCISQMVCAGGLLMKKQDFLDLGGMDESFGSLYTDLDICLRLKERGYLVGAASKAITYHFGGDFSLIKGAYKNASLKTDIKGAFMRKHANILEQDMIDYYKQSAKYFEKTFGGFSKYFFCNMMNVANPRWYESVVQAEGVERYDRIERASGQRDADSIGLFEIIGYDLMVLGAPIAYFVDRYVSVKNNAFWWSQRRDYQRDIVIDRNANVLPLLQILKGKDN